MSFSRKSEMRTMKDGRVILLGQLYSKMRIELCHLAEHKCEKCGDFTPLTRGHADHVNRRGGGRRDDRIFVEGKRNLRWLCPDCHEGKHNPKAVPAKQKMSESEFRALLGLEAQ